MMFNKSLKNILLAIFATFILSACSTAKKSGDVSDVYTGKETVKYLASGVPDRVFFATNKSSLTTAARETLRKQATYLRKNKNLNVTVEGHADERGTREYNLALGERRANAARDYLMTYGISGTRISVIGLNALGFGVDGECSGEGLRRRRVKGGLIYKCLTIIY